MALSRAVFGQRGNLLPGALIWVARWGWETINAVTGAYALLSVLDILCGVRSGTALIVVTLLLFVVATFAISGLGIKAVQRCATWAAWLFGAFSVLVLARLVVDTDWGEVFGRGAGLASAMITAIGLVAAGGISWVPSSPDFTRYLPGTASSAAIVRNTVGGAGVVVLPLLPMGMVMASATPDLASAPDPVSFLGEILPLWLAVPYLLIALAGTLLINSMSMYSAGFTAQTLGFRVPRHWAVSVNAVISLVLGGILMPAAKKLHGHVRGLPLPSRGGLLGLGRGLRRGPAAPYVVRRRGAARHDTDERLPVPGRLQSGGGHRVGGRARRRAAVHHLRLVHRPARLEQPDGRVRPRLGGDDRDLGAAVHGPAEAGGRRTGRADD
jgi:hypothetical protein